MSTFTMTPHAPLGWGRGLFRSVQGVVVDYLDLHYHGRHWPAFNVADIAIVGGVSLLLITSVISPAQSSKR